MYVHPTVLKLETVLVADSLKTLCKVLDGASGNISPPIDSPDRTLHPIMDATLTIRSILRFVELRHGAGDDLQPSDFNGKCGSGVKVLLKKCKDNQDELLTALDTRVDDVIRLVRAFYDQPKLLSKYQGFFRTVIERNIPNMLVHRAEPLPRLSSFLEPYGEVQLTFLYEAALSGSLRNRLDEFQLNEFLETVESWTIKARGRRLAVIQANKVRRLVLETVSLDIPLSPAERARWAAHAVWASVPEMTPDVVRLEGKIKAGLIEREDPGELLALCIDFCADDIRTKELFEFYSKMLLGAFSSASIARAREVLQDINPRPSMKYPRSLVKALVGACKGFAEKAPLEELEALLKLWRTYSLEFPACTQGTAAGLLERPATEAPGPSARCGALLCQLGVPDELLRPLVGRLMEWPAGEAGEGRGAVGRALALLGELWAPEGPLPRITVAEDILRFVGPMQEPLRAVDTAADLLLLRLASQLPTVRGQVESEVRAWRSEGGEGRLPALVAPLILQEAGSPGKADAKDGDLARSAVLLAEAQAGKALNLLDLEWALGPFAYAAPADVAAAVGIVAKSCATQGMPEGVLEDAGRRWVDAGSPPAGLGVRIVKAGLDAWEQLGVRGEGLEELRRTHAWLSGEAAAAADVPAFRQTAQDIAAVGLLLGAIDGVAPSLADLSRGKEGPLGGLGDAGEAALIDAVATSWSVAMPGLLPGITSSYLSLWWQGVENSRNLAEQIVSSIVDELRWMQTNRMQATWTNGSPPGGYAPSWRLEGLQKVPWFVSKKVVSEAYEEGRARPPAAPVKKFLTSSAILEKAKAATGGRCVYCGSAHELRAKEMWPSELGGQTLESNLGAHCVLCAEFGDRLGVRRWGEVLAAKPEEAANTWWQAQKEANMQFTNFTMRNQT